MKTIYLSLILTFSLNGEADGKMIVARDPIDAVDKAIAAAEDRLKTGLLQPRMTSG